MAGPLGFVLLDAQYRLVFANDEAIAALTPEESDSTISKGVAALQNLPNVLAALPVNSKLPAELDYADRTWRLIRFTIPRGSDPDVMTALVLGPGPVSLSHTGILARMFRLTVRETEALELYMQGLSAKEVATRMRISVSTAKAFLRLITIKMGVCGRAEMMSKILNFMCGSSLTCPFRTSLQSNSPLSPKK